MPKFSGSRPLLLGLALLVAGVCSSIAAPPARAALGPDYYGATIQPMFGAVASDRWPAFPTQMAGDGLREARFVASVAVARADVSFGGTLVTPTRLDASTESILYYLRMRSGDAEERFSVRLIPPAFATRGGANEGQSVDGPRAIALQGPGALGQQAQDPRFIKACSTDDSAFHGYATGPASVDVLLPPQSTTTLAVRYATGRRPPWVDGDYRMTFTAQPTLVGAYDVASPFAGGPTLARAVSLRTSGPVVGGRTGAHLLLSTTPAGVRGDARSPRTVGRRMPIRITGRLLPARRGRTVILQSRRAGGRLRTVAKVRTDARGRFRAVWRLGASGTFELWARYPRQAGDLTPDRTSCPLRFRAR